jgi:hypothetical protein
MSTHYADLLKFIKMLVNKYPELEPLQSKFCKTTDYDLFITVLGTIPEINKIARAPEHEAQQMAYDMIDKMLLAECHTDSKSLSEYDKSDISKLCTYIEYFADIAIFG